MKLKTLERPAFRPGGHPSGAHRVLDPTGVLPQAALRLDVSLPIYSNEILVAVEALNLDSASFRQLKEWVEGDGEKIAQEILRITRERGKMHNPVTGSGGMLVGRIVEHGEDFPQTAKPGERIATLVSLTATPLHLEKIIAVDWASGQIRVEGYAILFADSLFAPLPRDLPEGAALAIFDVCGAPAWTRRLAQVSDRILILGAGKAGVLSAAAARETVPAEALCMADCMPATLENPVVRELAGTRVLADARDPLAFRRGLEEKGLGEFDLVINAGNAPETEAACILAAREGGKILFFNMATQFQRAVLTAEALVKDVELIMGNGFARGHWEYALGLVRRNERLRLFFEGMK